MLPLPCIRRGAQACKARERGGTGTPQLGDASCRDVEFFLHLFHFLSPAIIIAIAHYPKFLIAVQLSIGLCGLESERRSTYIISYCPLGGYLCFLLLFFPAGFALGFGWFYGLIADSSLECVSLKLPEINISLTVSLCPQTVSQVSPWIGRRKEK